MLWLLLVLAIIIFSSFIMAISCIKRIEELQRIVNNQEHDYYPLKKDMDLLLNYLFGNTPSYFDARTILRSSPSNCEGILNEIKNKLEYKAEKCDLELLNQKQRGNYNLFIGLEEYLGIEWVTKNYPKSGKVIAGYEKQPIKTKK